MTTTASRARPVPAEFAGHLAPALAEVSVPAYVIDDAGIIRWLNPAAEAIVGPVEGRPFTDVLAMDSAAARKLFAERLAGDDADHDVVVVGPDGRATRLEVSAVRLATGHQVVGVFGLAVPGGRAPASDRPGPLTPRQHEILQLLADGRSTASIAQQLVLSEQTVRNHVRHILGRLDARSRLEAVAIARRDGLVRDR